MLNVQTSVFISLTSIYSIAFFFFFFFLGGGGVCLRYIRVYDFVYVSLALPLHYILIFTAQNFSRHQAPNLCTHVCRWNFVSISYFILWKKFDDIEKYLDNFIISNSTATNPMGWNHIKFATKRSHTAYRFIISYLGSMFYFFHLLPLNGIECAQYYFQLKSNLLR